MPTICSGIATARATEQSVKHDSNRLGRSAGPNTEEVNSREYGKPFLLSTLPRKRNEIMIRLLVSDKFLFFRHHTASQG